MTPRSLPSAPGGTQLAAGSQEKVTVLDACSRWDQKFSLGDATFEATLRFRVDSWVYI